MGAFTTAIACDNIKRSWIGFELGSEYCEGGRERVNENRQKLGLKPVEILF